MAKIDEKMSESVAAENDKATKTDDNKAKREIKGGIPYVVSPGTLKKTLDAIIPAERPDSFSGNYMETILKLTGGSARSIPPFLKKMQFIGTDGAPTILYSKFKTDGGRSQAAYEGLRNAFGELFKRNEYIHKADENAVKDVIVEITGLKKSDNIIRFMYGSFDTVRGFISGEVAATDAGRSHEKHEEESGGNERHQEPYVQSSMRLGLSYQINIVLPETENISIFNAIFRSLRENLLK